MHSVAAAYEMGSSLNTWGGTLAMQEQHGQSETALVATHITPYAPHRGMPAGLEHFHPGHGTTFDLQPVNRRVIVNLGYMATAAAAAAFAPVTGLATPGMWVDTYNAPQTVVAWDNLQSRLNLHPAMTSPQVQSYLQATPGADAGAIRDLYDLAKTQFAHVRDLVMDYRFSRDYETEEPYLYLTIDTQGMETREVIKQEIALFEKIEQDARLANATRRHIITAV